MGVRIDKLFEGVLAILIILVNSVTETTAQVQAKKPEDCNTVCSYDYSPVCAYNGTQFVTYSNECELEAAQCLAKETPGTFVPQKEPTGRLCNFSFPNFGNNGKPARKPIPQSNGRRHLRRNARTRFLV